jgi:hypothetical protein
MAAAIAGPSKARPSMAAPIAAHARNALLMANLPFSGEYITAILVLLQ